MPPTVERDHVGDLCSPGREHCERRDEGMVALAMHDIPGFIGDDAGNARRKVIITLRGPGAHPPEAHAVDLLLAGRRPVRSVVRTVMSAPACASRRVTSDTCVSTPPMSGK